MILKADYQDIEKIASLAFEFFGDSLHDVGLVCDYSSVFDFVMAMVEHPDMELFIDKEGDEIRGIIGGHVHPWPFNKSVIVLEEMVWFVPEKYRTNPMISARLFKKLSAWGKDKGATTLIISSNIRAESERVCAFYERIGAKLTDKTFIGRLQ